MSSSVLCSSPSEDDNGGILDDLLTTNDVDQKKSENPPNQQTERIRTRQRKRGSFVVTVKKSKLNKRDDTGHRLFQKRLYSYPSASAPSRSSLRQSMVESQPKTEIEKVVLADCIKNHFLLSFNADSDLEASTENESSDVMVGALISRFKKVSLRKNEILFQEGSAADSLYVLYQGEVLMRDDKSSLLQDGNDKDHEKCDDDDDDEDEDDDNKYKIFGELELLTNSSSYKATAKVISDSCVLFRLSAGDFQSYFLPQQYNYSRLSMSTTTEEQKELEEEERLLDLLQKALPAEVSTYFFRDDDEDYDHHILLWKQLLSERKVRNFRKGDVLIHKSKRLNSLVIITDGLVRATDNTAGGQSYEDLLIGPGKKRNSFGWQSVLKMGKSMTDNTASSIPNKNRTMMGTIRAETDGRAIVISKKSFEKIFCHFCYNHGSDKRNLIDDGPLLMDMADLHWRRWKRTQLQQIMVFKDSGLDSTQINGLLDLMRQYEYGEKETIIQAGYMVDAAMYFVREGSVRLELNRGRDKKTIERGGYFGEKNMLLDQNKSENEKEYKKRSLVTAISQSASTKIDVLYLEECRKVVNTTILGLGMNSSINSIDTSVQWADLRRHKLIGTGSFGQVWLASTKTSDATESQTSGERETNDGVKQRMFALKVQAKYPLVRSGMADRLIAERNVMASLHSPFIMRLFNAFQDDYRLYMITSLLPGGELESILPENGFSEDTARFYAAVILEALTYMHRKHILHRDVKPENVLLDAKGYPVLIDLGFAKYVPDKTYTFCGSPMFMAPETIMYKGQNKGVDHWSWAVLVYRLVTGKYPFYQKGMDEIALYKRICKGAFEVTGAMSMELRMLMVSILYPDATQRLGSRANGWRDIFGAPWFTNSASLDLEKLRKQALPAPRLPISAKKNQLDDLETFIHQSSDDFEDLFDDNVCGKVSDNQQLIFSSFGMTVSKSIGDII